MPHVGAKEIDLYALHRLVVGYGGESFVTRGQLWGSVASALGLSESAAERVREVFHSYLLPFVRFVVLLF